VNDAEVGRLTDIYQSGSLKDEVSLGINVSKGSVVKLVSSNNDHLFDVGGSITFTEFKLNSLNPQLAFPNWDDNKKESITENDWIANKDGWILFESINSYDTTIMINGITVGRLGQYDLVGYGTEIIPITVGDKLTYSGDTNNIIGTNFTLTFYPVKSVSQSDCASYVIESGRFNSSDGTTHSNNSENDSWYREYSDGWCE
jgi:hypothetical protein